MQKVEISHEEIILQEIQKEMKKEAEIEWFEEKLQIIQDPNLLLKEGDKYPLFLSNCFKETHKDHWRPLLLLDTFFSTGSKPWLLGCVSPYSWSLSYGKCTYLRQWLRLQLHDRSGVCTLDWFMCFIFGINADQFQFRKAELAESSHFWDPIAIFIQWHVLK